MLAGRFSGATYEDEVNLLDSCNQLETLGISFNAPASAAYLPVSLQHLVIMTSFATDELLITVARRCRGLSKLTLTAGWILAPRLYTNKGLAAIAKGCTKLRKLILEDDADFVPALALDLWHNTNPYLEVRSVTDMWDFEVFAPAALGRANED